VEVTIRAYDPRDAAGLADVFFRSVRQVALSDYTAAQVRAWAPEPRTAGWAHGEASDGRLVLVAADADDRPVAYIDLEPDGHIDRVFCAPEAAGQGIASRLYDAVEAAAREQGIRSLFTEASELARRLFERKGFAVAERQDLVIRGVAIHNYRMVKALDLPNRCSWCLPGPREGRRAARAGHDLSAEHVGGGEAVQELPAGQGGREAGRRAEHVGVAQVRSRHRRESAPARRSRAVAWLLLQRVDAGLPG
jgi:putative acetyltransferase